MSQFHNPYHFVPLPESPGGPERCPLDGETPLPAHVSHDHFVPGTFSGSIECDITTVTPMVIGSKQTGENPKSVEPFLLPGTEDPGIPGSALRGLISSILEATTLSAFRVMEDRIFSYRKVMSEGLSALGMVVEGKNGSLALFPVSEPHYRGNNLFNGVIPQNSGNYEIMFNNEFSKIYFANSTQIRTPQFLAACKTNTAPFGGPFYALPKNQIDSKQRGPVHLGKQTRSKPEPWDPENHSEETHIRGILRVLGVSGDFREQGMPTRKHEFFIPFNVKTERILRRGEEVFPILPEALERFNQLADERTKEADNKTPPEDLLPFTPNGQTRAPLAGKPDADRPRNAYHLKPGDIVFFRPSQDGGTVAEVSLSSIWRGRVEKVKGGSVSAATLSDFIASADPALLPMGDSRKSHLTPAELLFGYTEHKGKSALAGRLRFSHAAPLPGQGDMLHHEFIDLQILNSPKPPSPNFYFRKRKAAAWIAKSEIRLENHQIQGRKSYLHTQEAEGATDPADRRWTMHPENVRSGTYDRMRVRARPVLSGKSFRFEIRFDNLSRFELGALLHALRPAPEFRHKIGMGKPLGLGTVRIDPLTLKLVDRHRRYAEEDISKPSTTIQWSRDPETVNWSCPAPPKDSDEAPDKIIGSFLEAIREYPAAKKTLDAILTLGNPANIKHPVHYPQVPPPAPDSAAFETDRYKWFVQNDSTINGRHPGQFLAPLVNHLGQTTASLPKLDRGQSENPPATRYEGQAIASPARQVSPQALVPPAPPTPRDLIGKTVECEVVEHLESKKKGIRVRFDVPFGGKNHPGFVEVGKFERSGFANAHPVGCKKSFKVVNWQNNAFQLQKSE